jgi:hypothetical protein
VSETNERLARAASLIAERLNAIRFEWHAQGTSVAGPGKIALKIAARHNDLPNHFDIGFVFDRTIQDSRVVWDCTTGWVPRNDADSAVAVADAVDKWIRVSAPVWLELMTLGGEYAAHYGEDDPEGFVGWHAIHSPLHGWGNSPGLDEMVGWFLKHPLLPAVHDAIAPGLKTDGPVGLRFFFGSNPKPQGTSEVQVDGNFAPSASEALGSLPWPRPDYGNLRAFVLLVHREPDPSRKASP